MMVRTTIEINIPEDGMKITTLEKIIFKELWKAGKELLCKAFKGIEENVLAKEDVRKEGKRERWMLTRFGRIKFSRYKVFFKRERRYGFALDEKLGLPSNCEPTPSVREIAGNLCLAYPYRQAAFLLSKILGEQVNHRTIWRWIQEDGKTLKGHLKEKREEIFTNGEAPEEDGKEREIIVVEIDGTGVPSREGKGCWMEAKLGVMYTGKELVSKTAKHKRYILKEKQVYASLENVDEFGKSLFTVGENKLSLTRAKNMLVVGDGDPWIKGLIRDWLPGAVYQLDHFHLKRNISKLAHGDKKLAQKMLRLALGGKIDKLISLINTGYILGKFSEDEARTMTRYLNTNREGIWGSSAFKDRVEGKEVLVKGSGAVEKNIDIMIARRFKREGMKWSKEGASNLLALRVLYQDEADWRRFWNQQAA